jgi:hypothetical protein
VSLIMLRFVYWGNQRTPNIQVYLRDPQTNSLKFFCFVESRFSRGKKCGERTDVIAYTQAAQCGSLNHRSAAADKGIEDYVARKRVVEDSCASKGRRESCRVPIERVCVRPATGVLS